MKKLAVLVAILSIAAVAAPAMSATNPFMDVPMNHWAYDAIGQLAAHNILSGYPDGLYKGKQQTTRYEMASALARALAVVDMTKATKQDVEMLKRLVVEFKDELEALGVRVDELDERVAVMENRLGGWHISGILALDVQYQKGNEPNGRSGWTDGNADSSIKFDDSKLIFERVWDDAWFASEASRHEGEAPRTAPRFMARLNGGDYGNAANFDRFFVDLPFVFDTTLTVGRFAWNWYAPYKLNPGGGYVDEDGNYHSAGITGGWNGDSLLTDWAWTGLGLTKNFGLGTVQAVVAHPENPLNGGVKNSTMGLYVNPNTGATTRLDWDTWMLMLGATFNFTEKFKLDLGGQIFVGDNAEYWTGPASTTASRTPKSGDMAFDKLWTIYAGLRFDFNDNIGLKGMFYHQKGAMDKVNAAGNAWVGNGYDMTVLPANSPVDDANHWRVMLDIKQPLLKFTGIWLEYGQYDQGFIARSDNSIFYGPTFSNRQAPVDIKYWRVALGQQWNEKWSTHIFYYGYKLDGNVVGYNNQVINGAKPAEIGLGVQYKMNDYTTMGLNYMHVKTDDLTKDNDNVIRFRTAVSF